MLVISAHVHFPQSQPHYEHIHCCLTWGPGPAACAHIVNGGGERWCFPDYDWLLTHNHTATSSDTLLSHMYTHFSRAFSSSALAHTFCADTHMSNFVSKRRKYSAHFLRRSASNSRPFQMFPHHNAFESRAAQSRFVYCRVMRSFQLS